MCVGVYIWYELHSVLIKQNIILLVPNFSEYNFICK